MFLIVIKLIEVFARAIFTVGASFALPLADAGRFGITVTLITLSAFAIGWERYIDLQRRLVGETDAVFDAGVTHALKLFAFNGALVLPICLASIWYAAGLGPHQLVAVAAITIGEQLGNQLYGITLVQRRYRLILVTVTLRSLIVALFVGISIGFDAGALTLDRILLVWGWVSLAATLLMSLLWLRCRTRGGNVVELRSASRVFDQHRDSSRHFAIGLINVLALQLDRLIVGTVLPSVEAGIYYRHALLVSFAYQMFNIASYNRIVKSVFAAAKTHAIAYLVAMIRRELAVIIGLSVVGVTLAIALNVLTHERWANAYRLDMGLAVLLLTGGVIRVAADLNALILNATMREARILRHQIASVAVGAVALIGLSRAFGVVGTASATLIPATLYLVLNVRAVKGG